MTYNFKLLNVCLLTTELTLINSFGISKHND